MKSQSIARRTVAVVLLAQISLALTLSSVTVWREWHSRMHSLDVQIAGRSDSLLGAIQDAEDPEDNIMLDPDELRLPANDRYAVFAASGKIVGRSAQGSLLAKDGPAGMQTVEMDGVRYRVQRRHALRIIDRAENGGVGLRRPVVMVYATPTAHVLHETLEAVGFSLTSIVLVATLTGFFATWLLRKTMRPIRDLALAAQQVSSSTLHFDAPHSAMRVDELRPLATTLSSLIADLGEAFAKEQRFVGDAAHELKTAVAVVRSAIQVTMLKQRSVDEYINSLEQLLRDNDRVEELVISMLELARIEQSTATSAAPIDLAEAVRRACQTMKPVAEARAIRLVLTLQPNLLIRLPMDRAETLIVNLLSNAIRYSDPGGAVAIHLDRQADGVSMKIADEGSGIRAEALPHVFDRFYRDDPSRSRISGGTGLGLAISRSIVVAAGGTIHIDSTAGVGTTVIVSFSNA